MTRGDAPGSVLSSAEHRGRLEALLRDLPDAHRELVERLDAERAAHLERARRHADSLQRLQDACIAIARVPDRSVIERELARHAIRIAGAAGAIVATGDPELIGTAPATHWVGEVEVDAAAPAEVVEAMREAARSGHAETPVATAHGGIVAIPIRASHRSEGTMAVYGVDAVDMGELTPLLATLAATAAASLAMAVVVDDSLRHKRQSEALAELARALGSSHRLGEVLHLGLRHSMAILGAEGADIALVRGDYLHVVAASGRAAPTQGLYYPIRESITGRAMLAGRASIVNEITDASGANPTVRALAGVEKFAAAPLRTPTGPIGVLSVINRVGDFGADDLRVLEQLASQLAVAVVKVRLFEEAEEATRELRAAFDAIAGGMAVVDSEGFVIRHNARLRAIAGTADGVDLTGRSLYEMVLGQARRPEADEPIGAAILQRTVGRGTMRRITGDRVFEVVASPHPQGGAVVTVDDVTSFLLLAERYRLVVESTTDAIVITDGSGTITFANVSATTLFGRDVVGAGLRLAHVVDAEARGAFEDAFLMAVGGSPARVEAVVRRPDGTQRTVSASLSPVRAGSLVTGVVVSLRDTTAEANARAAVATADRRYRNLFEAASDAIFTLDTAGIMTSANAACEAGCGQPRSALVGRRLVTYVDAADAAAVSRWIALALTGRPVQFECTIPRTDNTARLMSVSLTPLTEHQDITGLLGIARDVTETRAQAAALERAESRYARLVEAAEDGICTIDEEGHIVSANRSMRRIVRLTRSGIRGRHFADLVPPDQRAAAWAMFVATLNGGRRRGELRFVAPGGSPAVVSVSTTPLVEHDRVAGVLAILRDMTEERALFEAAARRDKLVALGELVGGVVHEVNSPLTGILAHAQLLQGDVPDDSPARRAADTIVAEARRAARIVGKLLTFARQNPPERIPTDVNQVIADTVELRRYPLKVQDVALELRLGEGIPPILADPFQLQQVFINLLSNAEQAVVARGAPPRWIEIGSFVQDDEVVVAVRDSGAGIAPEHLAHIFNPFYTTKPKGVGTGLGLSISFGIVREHGGYIQAASPHGEGATFTVHLPIRGASAPGAAAPPIHSR